MKFNVHNSLIDEEEIARYNRRASYVFVILLIFVLVIFSIFRTSCVSAVVVKMNSMYPTLKENNVLLVVHTKPVERGEIVVFEDKENDETLYVKRIIALEGDVVWTVNGEVYIEYSDALGLHTVKLDEDYLVPGIKTYKNDMDIPRTTIPDNCIYALGDNRPLSNDSRGNAIGFVNVDLILGIVPQFVVDNKDGILGSFYKFF